MDADEQSSIDLSERHSSNAAEPAPSEVRTSDSDAAPGTAHIPVSGSQ
jgi:hypothetical protein